MTGDDAGGSTTAKGDLDAQVGLAVRAGRAAADLTLAELSARSGVSTAMISKIERGQVSPSLVSLNALARAMGVPIINLFAGTVEMTEAALVRAGEGITVRRAGSTYGHNYKQLGRIETDGQEFESFLITLEAPVQGTPIFQHSGVELLHLIEGDVTYRVGDALYELRPGDTLSFEAKVPHGPVHMNSARTVFLTVIARPGKISL